MELGILIFVLLLLGDHEAITYSDEDFSFIHTDIHNLQTAVKVSRSKDPPESIVVSFNGTEVNICSISVKSDSSRGRCGVMPMGGIMAALRHHRPGSPLWVFTDAPATDPEAYHEVVYLSQKMGNQIYFAIVDRCNDSNIYSTYRDVAAATNGQVFYLQKNETGELLDYEENLTGDPKDIVTAKTIPPALEGNEFNVNVDNKMSELIIAVTDGAEHPAGPAVKVSDPSGLAVATTDVTKLGAVTVVKLPVNPGVYKVQVSSPRETRVVVTASTPLTFQHGFSAHTPSDFNDTTRIAEPGPGHLSIMLGNEEGLELRSVQILDMDYAVLVEKPLKPVNAAAAHFHTTEQISILPNQMFQIAIKIHDASSGTNLTRHGSTPITPIAKCLQPLEAGPCQGLSNRWHYDSTVKECRQFTYGGCLGNGNRFASEAECDRECGAAAAPLEPPTPVIGQPKPVVNTNTCDEDFACGKNLSICIPDYWVCDGESDCPAGEDEEIDMCRDRVCPPTMFRCPRGKCIRQSWVCNGENDCSDMEASDEQNCTTSHHSPLPRPENADVPSNTIPCLWSWVVTCGNKKCIPHWWRCDGKNDCGDNSDEVGCEQAKCQHPKDPGPCEGGRLMWYHDNTRNQCFRFVYGGCGGNDNRFHSEAECRTQCWPPIKEPTPNTTELQNCELGATEKTPNMQTNETCRQRDEELETFGRYVASSLRKLNEEVAINTQDEIQAILSKYKLRNLKRTSG